MDKNNNVNKFEANKKYFTISIYTIAVVLICTIIVKSIFTWADTSANIRSVFSTLSPFFLGVMIAYFLYPLVNLIGKYIFCGFFSIKSQKLAQGLAIFTTYLLLIGAISTFFIFLVPTLIANLYDLALKLPDWYDQINDFIMETEKHLHYIDFTSLNEAIENMNSNIFTASNLTNIVTNVLPAVYLTSVSLVKGLISLIIAIMISCYLLIDRPVLSRNFKRFLYAFFPKEKSDLILINLKECNYIFSRFVSGKALDSLIIGILCMILMTILKLPYASLISIIVGVTNMIPYFGPFIGAIPGAIILLMYSPVKMLIFLIMILALQQFDGLYLGPKILGDSTGLRPLWIIFAITAGGAAAGVVGMFLGVPLLAVVAHLMNKIISYRLAKRSIKIK